MKGSRKEAILYGIALLLCLSMGMMFSSTAYAADGTDGSELQIFQPAKLEIQLGTNWADAQFRLRTDAGMYPDPIAVDGNGILRLEIGGSSQYILSCIYPKAATGQKNPQSIEADATETGETFENKGKSSSEGKELWGIPILHLVLFLGGLVATIGVLIRMHLLEKRSKANSEFEEDSPY